jgi:hypothetical protein
LKSRALTAPHLLLLPFLRLSSSGSSGSGSRLIFDLWTVVAVAEAEVVEAAAAAVAAVVGGTLSIEVAATRVRP